MLYHWKGNAILYTACANELWTPFTLL